VTMQYRTVANIPDSVHTQGFPDIASYKIHSSGVNLGETTKVTAFRQETVTASLHLLLC